MVKFHLLKHKMGKHTTAKVDGENDRQVVAHGKNLVSDLSTALARPETIPSSLTYGMAINDFRLLTLSTSHISSGKFGAVAQQILEGAVDLTARFLVHLIGFLLPIPVRDLTPRSSIVKAYRNTQTLLEKADVKLKIAKDNKEVKYANTLGKSVNRAVHTVARVHERLIESNKRLANNALPQAERVPKTEI